MWCAWSKIWLSDKPQSHRVPVVGQGGACAQQAVPKKMKVAENLPIPHPKHNCGNRNLEHNVQANFRKFRRSSLPIRGTRSCGIQALSNLAPHLKQLRMVPLWGRLWGRLGFSFWNVFGLPIPWDKIVINNIFGEIKLAMLWKPTSQIVHAKGGRDVRDNQAKSNDISHGKKSHQDKQPSVALPSIMLL